MNRRRFRNISLLGLLAVIIIAGLFFGLHEERVDIENIAEETKMKILPKSNAPEISGWIAWWIEDDGYVVTERQKNNLSEVSPGWFKLDKNKQLVETGKTDKKTMSEKIKGFPLKLYPMITTDLTDQELADFIKDGTASDKFIGELIGNLKYFKADGLDLDFENIGAPYLTEFSTLIKKLSSELKKNSLAFSVTVQAQTGKNDWSGLKGQDLNLIGQYADEVRLMIYDNHGQFSKPGPITPMDWYQQVLDYNLKIIPKEKLVVGLPTYGYIWGTNGDFKSFQFKDFVAYTKDQNYTIQRDPESSELEYTNSQSTGWLSDSAAVINKIEYARKLGQNRFILWNLAGTDERLFEKDWQLP
jgi:spore germination protein